MDSNKIKTVLEDALKLLNKGIISEIAQESKNEYLKVINEIQKALKEVMKGRTSFIIAHRISSLKHADEIIVLDDGNVKERGTHEELLRKENGAYKRIYDIQYQDHDVIMNAVK